MYSAMDSSAARWWGYSVISSSVLSVGVDVLRVGRPGDFANDLPVSKPCRPKSGHSIGGERIVTMLAGEQLPRIC